MDTTALLWFDFGLVSFVFDNSLLVHGAVRSANRLGVFPLRRPRYRWFRRPTPELTTRIDAALSETPGIAIGDVVGSNIANPRLPRL